MRFVNCTKHEINVYHKGECVLHLDPCKNPARVITHQRGYHFVNGIPIHKNPVREVINLPEPRNNTMYVVSGFTLSHCPDRDDLVAPCTSQDSLIIDDRGNIKGVKRLVKHAKIS